MPSIPVNGAAGAAQASSTAASSDTAASGDTGTGNDQPTQAFDNAIRQAQQTLAISTEKGAVLYALKQRPQ